MRIKNVLITGPIAPPFGGVSVHILRLSELLKTDFIFDFVDESQNRKNGYFNLRSLNLIKYLRKIKKADVIYINSGKTSLRIFHLLFGNFFSKKMILTLHSLPRTKSKYRELFTNRIYQLATKTVIVNPDFKKDLGLPMDKLLVKDAFIPPIIENEPTLPEYISEWISNRKMQGDTIICANASSLQTFNNQDLYGIDLCIEVCKLLKTGNTRVSFIFVVSAIEKHKDQFLQYKKQIEVLNLNDNFLLINEKLSFVRLIQESDIVLRATNTDGDALTVREALFLGKPVLASDVVIRPQGVFLFKNRDSKDLQIKLSSLVESHSSESAIINSDSREQLKEFYFNLFDSNPTKNKKFTTSEMVVI